MLTLTTAGSVCRRIIKGFQVSLVNVPLPVYFYSTRYFIDNQRKCIVLYTLRLTGKCPVVKMWLKIMFLIDYTFCVVVGCLHRIEINFT